MELFEKGVETGDLSEASLAQTYRNMGITCSRDRKYEKAIEFYNNALKLKPTEPWKDLVNKGNALSYLKRFEEAVALYDQAQKLKPQYNEAYFNRGITYERQDKLPEAVEQFKKAYMHGLRSPALQERFTTSSSPTLRLEQFMMYRFRLPLKNGTMPGRLQSP
jgi:tetratricopeptide (TPR) repeat protein